jgi:hypothetical protein
MKNKAIFLGLVWVLILNFSSCGHKEGSTAYDTAPQNKSTEMDYVASESPVTTSSEQEVAVKAVSQVQNPDNQNIIPDQPVIIKNASVRFQVENFKDATQKIKDLVKESGGYIASSNENNSGYSMEGNTIIRVEAKNFEVLIEKLITLSIYLNYNNTRAEDVTEEYVDLQARLKNKRELEKRYIEFLKEAKKVEDMLSIEREINNIRSEIEAKEGRLKYLMNRAQYSTIELSYYQTFEVIKNQPDRSFFTRIAEGVVNGWDGFLDFLVALSNAWVFIFLMILVAFGIYKWRKSKTTK